MLITPLPGYMALIIFCMKNYFKAIYKYTYCSKKICVTLLQKENPAIKTSKSHWLQQKFNGFGRGGYADTYMCNAYTLNALHLFFVILYEQERERVQRYLFNVFILYLWL